jgi:hypothetical protein
MPKAKDESRCGHIGVLVFPSGRSGDVVKVGRWNVSGKNFYHSEYIPTHELRDVIEALVQLEHKPGAEYRAKLQPIKNARTGR